MSNTRHAAPGEQRDERFASDPALNRGLKAGDVVRRCQALTASREIELALFLQHVSTLPGGFEKLATDLLAAFPDRIGTPKMRELGTNRKQYCADQVRALRDETSLFSLHRFILRGEELLSDEDEEDMYSDATDDFLDDTNSPDRAVRQLERNGRQARRARVRATEAAKHPISYPVEKFAERCRATFLYQIPEILRKFCLAPALELKDVHAFDDVDGEVPVFDDLPGALLSYMDIWERNKLAPLVITELGSKVIEALDYAEAQRTIVLVEGFARTGKTFISRAWTEARPGRRRFVSLSEATSEKEFFAEVSQAVGGATGLGLKANELRERVNCILRPGYFTLVVDEGHHLLPTRNLREAVPRRLEWIRCSLANYGVPVAVVSTHQFSRTARLVEKNCHAWISDQWTGRLGFIAQLPDRLAPEDIAAVARYHLPNADKRIVEELVDYAQVSKKYLAAVDHLVRAARHEARKHGRENVTYSDILAGFDNTIAPSDRALASMNAPESKAEAGRGRSKLFAVPVQPHGKPFSEPGLGPRETGSQLATANQDRSHPRSESAGLAPTKV